jgi:hypothetical protein
VIANTPLLKKDMATGLAVCAFLLIPQILSLFLPDGTGLSRYFLSLPLFPPGYQCPGSNDVNFYISATSETSVSMRESTLRYLSDDLIQPDIFFTLLVLLLTMMIGLGIE